MKRGLVVGMANAGKTLFCTRFAEFLGVRDLQWMIERTDGRTECKRISTVRGETETQPSVPTRFLQSMCLPLSSRSSARRLLVTDSAGFTDGSVGERGSIAQTLHMLVEADIILHVIDAHLVGCRAGDGGSWSGNRGLQNVDNMIARYAERKQGGYVVLANKMDMPAGKAGYRFLCKQFSKHRVLPVSALYATGFREVRQHVWRLA